MHCSTCPPEDSRTSRLEASFSNSGASIPDFGVSQVEAKNRQFWMSDLEVAHHFSIVMVQ